jgi:BMFP domain-containing protein YqiC
MMLDSMMKAIRAVLPPELADDVKQNIEAVVKSNFERMNLVTREQMEIQEKIMNRTRERVIELERKIKLIEDSLEK